MSDQLKDPGVQPPPKLKFSIDSAAMFTRSKGRMPWDVHELRAWLREFAQFETERADRLHDLLVESTLASLPRTLVVKKLEKTP